jgi:V8-like Glu-specific endopeptidase
VFVVRDYRGRMLKAFAVAAIALTTGCSAIQGPGMGFHKHQGPLRASSTHEEGDEIRLLEEPTGIAAKAEDAIVRIVTPTTTCTGSVITEDLILTAHHCLVERGAKGEFEKKLVDPSTLRVEIGGDYFAWAEVPVQHIVAPPCGESGGSGDVAVLVLKRKLIGLTPMNFRLDSPPKVGEEVTAVGFGRCALNGDAIKRKNRESGAVKAVFTETMSMDAAICPGDSGGPIISRKSREIIGVISLSAMDHDENTRGASVMARLDMYKAVFRNATSIAEGASPQEVPPLECKH